MRHLSHKLCDINLTILQFFPKSSKLILFDSTQMRHVTNLGFAGCLIVLSNGNSTNFSPVMSFCIILLVFGCKLKGITWIALQLLCFIERQHSNVECQPPFIEMIYFTTNGDITCSVKVHFAKHAISFPIFPTSPSRGSKRPYMWSETRLTSTPVFLVKPCVFIRYLHWPGTLAIATPFS